MYEAFSSSDLKTILHSKRANLYYLEHCRVLLNAGRVEYVTQASNENLYWNIPIANTTAILLGSGTSITQGAMRELAKAGVVVGFSGGGGTPLYAACEPSIDFCWLTSQSEYRPTEYLQGWVSFWFDESDRVKVAKFFQEKRVSLILNNWCYLKSREDFNFDEERLRSTLSYFSENLSLCSSTQDILLLEARVSKALFKLAANAVDYGEFSRQKNGLGTDPANRLLDYGNYLAYGLAASACWVLGLPHSLSVLHGKTRRGGLVFDVADIIKDAIVLPLSFVAAIDGCSTEDFKPLCLEHLQRMQSLDVMIECLETAVRTFRKN